MTFLPSLKEVYLGDATGGHPSDFCFEQYGYGGQNFFLEILIMESVSLKQLANVKTPFQKRKKE